MDCSNGQPAVGEDDAHTGKAGVSALSKIRGKFKVRSMANTWRQRANNKALPSLTPFIPYLLRDELLEVAKWYGNSLDCSWLELFLHPG